MYVVVEEDCYDLEEASILLRIIGPFPDFNAAAQHGAFLMKTKEYGIQYSIREVSLPNLGE